MNNENNTAATVASNPLNFYGVPDRSKVAFIPLSASCKMWTEADPMPGFGDAAEEAVTPCE